MLVPNVLYILTGPNPPVCRQVNIGPHSTSVCFKRTSSVAYRFYYNFNIFSFNLKRISIKYKCINIITKLSPTFYYIYYYKTVVEEEKKNITTKIATVSKSFNSAHFAYSLEKI